jgi:carbon monoxide dehydrogenase subunit G
MELNGQQRIAAARQKVWDALNDARVLKACIPGCESLTQDGDHAFDAIVQAKVGPVRAKFSGRVELSEIRPPESYRISGEGKGGAAGVAKGSADVALAEDGDGTMLTYVVRADVGGKLAQIGSRLVQSTANKYAADFFVRFGDIVTGAVPIEVPLEAAAPTGAPAPQAPPQVTQQVTPPGTGDANSAHLRRLNWVLLAIVVALIGYILATR